MHSASMHSSASPRRLTDESILPPARKGPDRRLRRAAYASALRAVSAFWSKASGGWAGGWVGR